MSNNLGSRIGHIIAVAAFTFFTAGGLATAPVLAAEAEDCPNEQVRQESRTDPATGRPYSVGLPECRAYEMVSPLEKGGSDTKELNGGLPAAADGEGVAWASQNAFGDAESANFGPLGSAQDSYISRRREQGWRTSSALAPIGQLGFTGYNFDAAAEELSPESSCGVKVASNELRAVSVACGVREANGAWQVTPAYQNTTGANFLDNEGYPFIELEGSSHDLSTIVFQSRGGANNGAAFLDADTSTNSGDGLYQVAGLGSASSELSLVNVDNGGNEIGSNMGTLVGGIGRAESEGGGPAFCASLSVENGSSAYQAISADGQTIYFTACPSNTAGGVNTIYARRHDKETVAISSPSPSQCTVCNQTSTSAAFEGASADGTKAFFLTNQQLVNADTDTSTDLYEYDFADPPGKNLIQLSVGGPGDLTRGSGAEVQGVVRTSSDGSHVYFVAKGVLTTVPNDAGDVAQAQADNLYAVDTEDGETKFVGDLCSNKQESGVSEDSGCPATLNGATFEGTNDSALWSSDQHREAQTTPDGRYLVFTTYAKLIPAGIEAATNDAQQVYRYDFDTGKLARISIGEPAFPASQNGNTPGMNAAVASPRKDPLKGPDGALASINDDSRAISDEGATIVFATPERLQASDVNTGTEPGCSSGETGCDVYAWHECTNGTCEDGMTGEVSMITPGDDPTSVDTAAGAASMSASGSDIFFFTGMPLVGWDTDQLVDVYDARISGGFAAPAPELSCSGEACQGGASSSPAFGASGTSSFTGGGNLTPGSISFPPATGKVSITKHSVKGSTIALSVKAPAKGRISASGSRLTTVKRSVSKSGTYGLKLTLTKAGKASLRKHHLLKLKIRVAFTPASGEASSASITIRVKQ